MRPIAILSLSAAVAFGLSACGSEAPDASTGGASSAIAASTPPATSEPAPGAATPTTSDAGTGSAAGASAPGAYLTKAEYEDQAAVREGTKVVYFFHADWCPSCRATESAIDADGVPDGLTVVKLDFDSETDLRKDYGVTQQHTFVQVDADGSELAKWTGSVSGADIEAKTV